MILDNPHRASVIMRVLRSGGKETGKSASVMGCGEIPQATPAVKMPGGWGGQEPSNAVDSGSWDDRWSKGLSPEPLEGTSLWF